MDEKATPTEDAMTLNQDVIYHFKDDDDDPSEDVVILAEAVISPTEVFKPSEKSESDTKTSKRSLENENQCSLSKKKEKGIKKSKMFNIFNNNVKEAKREKGKRKVRKTPGENDDYLMTEADLKDSYINAHTSPLEDLDDSLEESPPLTNFRNLASNPDLTGEKNIIISGYNIDEKTVYLHISQELNSRRIKRIMTTRMMSRSQASQV